jgi:integrase/recombinase XerD
MSDFFETVRRFLLDYLPNQRCLSSNTILSYKQTLNLFVSWIREEKQIPTTQLCFSRIDNNFIIEFLSWIEDARGCSANTRNQRLMGLRSFFNYAGEMDCTNTALYLSALRIPSKKAPGKIVEALSDLALTALFQQPDPTKT